MFLGWFDGDEQYTADTVYQVAGDTTVTGLISEWTDGSVDLTSTERIMQTINDNALVILLCGIIGVLAGFILIRRS